MRTAAIFLCTVLSCGPQNAPVPKQPSRTPAAAKPPAAAIRMENVTLSNNVIIPGTSSVRQEGDARIIIVDDRMNDAQYRFQDSGYTVTMVAIERGEMVQYDAPAYTHTCADGKQYFFLRGMLPDDCFPE